MDYALNLDAILPGAKYSGSLTANTEAAYNAIRWEDERPKPTLAELAAAQVAVQAKAAQAAAIASVYAPVAYNGKSFPVDPESMAKYEMAKQSRGRGKMTKAIAIATDGTVIKLTGTAAIDAFHGAMEDAVLARVDAIHDAI